MRQGSIVQTGGGRTALIVGHIRRAAVVVPIVRGTPRRRSDVPVNGNVSWSDAASPFVGHPLYWTEPAASRTGYVACAFAYAWPEHLLRRVGWASDKLLAAVLKAQIRELEAQDAPPSPLAAQIAADFRDANQWRYAA